MAKYILLSIAFPQLKPDIAKIFKISEKKLDSLQRVAKDINLIKMGLNLLNIQISSWFLEDFLRKRETRWDTLNEFFREYPEIALKHKDLLLKLIKRGKYPTPEILMKILAENLEILSDPKCPPYYILFAPKSRLGRALDMLIKRIDMNEILNAVSAKIRKNLETGILLLTIAPDDIRKIAYDFMEDLKPKFINLLIQDSDPNIKEIIETADPRFLALMKLKRGFSWIDLTKVIDKIKDDELLDFMKNWLKGKIKLNHTEELTLIRVFFKRHLNEKYQDIAYDSLYDVLSKNFDSIRELASFVDIEILLQVSHKLSKLGKAVKILNAYEKLLFMDLDPKIILKNTREKHKDFAIKYPKRLLALWKQAGYPRLEPEIAFIISTRDANSFIRAIELFGVEKCLEFVPNLDKKAKKEVLLHLAQKENFELIDSVVPPEEIFSEPEIVKNLTETNFEYLLKHAKDIPWKVLDMIGNIPNKSAIILIENMIREKDDIISPLDLNLPPEIILKATQNWHNEIAKKYPKKLLDLWRSAGRRFLDLDLALELIISHGDLNDLIFLADKDINIILNRLNEVKDSRREKLLIYLASKIDVLKLPIDPSELLSIPELANRVNDQRFIVDNFIKAPKNLQKMLLEKLDRNHKIKLASKLPPDNLTEIINTFNDSEIKILVGKLVEKGDLQKAIDVIYETKALFAIPKKLWARIWKNYPYLAAYGSRYPEFMAKGALVLNIKEQWILDKMMDLIEENPTVFSDIILDLYQNMYINPRSFLRKGHFLTASALLFMLNQGDKKTIKWLTKKAKNIPTDLKLLKKEETS
ncbi:MAG: hypothetical protein J7K59_03310, partial [Candidatus Korarchaeota archaeon]|nr:hypothetical protein [Candidatus Korarchaeota archaeon]